MQPAAAIVTTHPRRARRFMRHPLRARRHRAAVSHPQHDGRAWASRELRRRDAWGWERLDRQHILHQDLIERMLGAERVGPHVHHAGLLLSTGWVWIQDRRPAAIGLLPAIHITPASDDTDEVKAGLLADEREQTPAEARQLIRRQKYALAKPFLVVVELRQLGVHSHVSVL